uniref:Uncharacterized protein n=1 Tax=Helicotheca tamesis TaxID=374047 RepID=A0A7S2GTT6_9STRA|mmetsp:Transcript_11775/g.16299  ORF Transcript_11775/g.16299 Transcript_11775/m.16299 type:complete len:164 (+) Transcript_11775:118-609(+)
MSWYTRTAIKSALRATASGAAITLVSTTCACTLALAVEGAAHRALYRFFPHWYKDVRYAYGLPQLEQEYQQRLLVSNKAAADDKAKKTSEEKTIQHQHNFGVTVNTKGEIIWVDNDDGMVTKENDIISATKTTDASAKIPTVEQLMVNSEQTKLDVLGCALTG